MICRPSNVEEEEALPKDKIKDFKDCLELRADAGIQKSLSFCLYPAHGKGERQEAGKCCGGAISELHLAGFGNACAYC